MGQLWGHNTDTPSRWAFSHNDLRSLYIGEIDAASQVGGDAHAVVCEDQRPERREILEAGSGEEAGGAREGGGQAGADLPGLHPRLLEFERRWVVLRRVRAEDVLAYRRETESGRRKALDELTARDQELGLQ